jgi:EcsC family protein
MAHDITTSEAKFINDAAEYLENPSLLMRMANVAGEPMEWILKGIDKIAPDVVSDAVNSALRKLLRFAIATIPDRSETPTDALVPYEDIHKIGSNVDFWSKLSVLLTGTTGGLFGWPGLAAELPITTTAMFRSIAAIGKEFGEDLSDPEVRMQCMSIFAYGGPAKSADAMESAYLSARVAMQAEIAQSAKFMAKAGAAELAELMQKGSAPMLARFLATIAAQFNVVVTQKMMLQAVPVVGGLTGGAINVAFIDHFNEVARFHFGIRSLERKYGLARVQSLYQERVLAIKQEAKPLGGPALGSISG